MVKEREAFLRVVMAVSADGYVSRGPDDPMSWTGPDDKRAFKLLTSVGGELGVGRVTAAAMPAVLPGRTLHVISRRPRTDAGQIQPPQSLGAFAFRYPGAWLIGGQTIAMEALECALATEVHLCRTEAAAFPLTGEDRSLAQLDQLTPFLQMRGQWHRAMVTKMGGVSVECWRRG